MTSSTRRAVALLALWITVVVVLAAADFFPVDEDLPPWRVVLGAAVPLAVFVLLFQQKRVRQTLIGIDPRILIAVQLWRVVGAAFLFGWADGELDAGFAVPAGIGDVATGVAAMAVLVLLLSERLARWHVVAFTALGIGDFAAAIATGALIRPDGLEQLPWVLFPTLAVPFFAAVHVLNWIQLNGAVDDRSVEHLEHRSPTAPSSIHASAGTNGSASSQCGQGMSVGSRSRPETRL